MAEILFENARVLDAAAGALRDGCAVLVEGDRVVELAEGTLRAAGARRIDLAGRTLMPGLIDAHVHVRDHDDEPRARCSAEADDARRERGAVGSSRRCCGAASRPCATRAARTTASPQAVERGLDLGPAHLLLRPRAVADRRPRRLPPRDDAPRLCACQIHSSGFSHVADGVPAVRKAAREELRRGASQVKIMASGGVASPSDPIWNLQYSAEEMRAIVEEAEGWRTYAMAHAYTPEAIRARGRRGRAHDRARQPDRPPDGASGWRAKGAFLVPTLVTYFKIDELGRKLGFPAVSQRKVKDVLDAGPRLARDRARRGRARSASAPISSARRTTTRAEEFAIRARVLPPAEVIRSATVVNAEHPEPRGRARRRRARRARRPARRRRRPARRPRAPRRAREAPPRRREVRPLRGGPAVAALRRPNGVLPRSLTLCRRPLDA